MVKLSRGSGHCPLMPMTGRSLIPSGLARTHPRFQSKLWVTAALDGSHWTRRKSNGQRKLDNDIAIVSMEAAALEKEFYRVDVSLTAAFSREKFNRKATRIPCAPWKQMRWMRPIWGRCERDEQSADFGSSLQAFAVPRPWREMQR